MRGARVRTIEREAELRAQRRLAIAADMQAWRERAARSGQTAEETRRRIASVTAERAALLEAPDTFLSERRRLVAEIESAETQRRAAADALALGEAALAEADRQARAALEGLAAARETRAAAEARREAARQRVTDVARQIEEGLETSLDRLGSLAGLKPGDEPPEQAEVERRLAALKAERERLGAVNLRAEDELAEVKGKARRADHRARRSQRGGQAASPGDRGAQPRRARAPAGCLRDRQRGSFSGSSPCCSVAARQNSSWSMPTIRSMRGSRSSPARRARRRRS